MLPHLRGIFYDQKKSLEINYDVRLDWDFSMNKS
jgi:hypothetical protein